MLIHISNESHEMYFIRWFITRQTPPTVKLTCDSYIDVFKKQLSPKIGNACQNT